jgi:glycosyltransferase involved in cell wall biosynthesis
MKIAIDCRNTYYNDPSLSVFTSECWQDIAALKPDHTFIFLKDRKDPFFSSLKNVDIRVLQPAPIGWYDGWKLQRVLRRLRVNRAVNTLPTGFRIRHLLNDRDGQATAKPDRLLLFEHNGDAYLQKNKPAPLVSFTKPACREAVAELPWTAAESVKTQFTGGRSFFLFTGNIDAQHQLIELLKAFSVFKKWQQSNMQLVIAGYTTGWTETLEEKLQHYKFRADIVLLKNPSVTVTGQLVAAAYAVVLPMAANVFCASLLLAVQSGKALIASDQPVNRAITGSAEWVDKSDTAEGFSKAMILLYKDEKHLQSLIQQSRQAVIQLNRDHLLSAIWNCVEK